jgi:hypothetical protein
MTVALEITHAVATLFMVAVIWFVQLVHYPLFARVGASALLDYERAHVGRISWIVVPAMLAELGSAAGLVALGSAHLRPAEAWLGLALVALLWACTFFVQVPIHARLQRTADPADVRSLVRWNWIRTAAWTARGVLVGVALARAFAVGAVAS